MMCRLFWDIKREEKNKVMLYNRKRNRKNRTYLLMNGFSSGLNCRKGQSIKDYG